MKKNQKCSEGDNFAFTHYINCIVKYCYLFAVHTDEVWDMNSEITENQPKTAVVSPLT